MRIKQIKEIGATPTIVEDWKTLVWNNTLNKYVHVDKISFNNTASTKLDWIEMWAQVNQTDSEIKTQYENNVDTNWFTDAEKTTLWNQSWINTWDQDLSWLVDKTTNQAIWWVKTFTASPIAPNPTADNQVATKEYVDSNWWGWGWVSNLDWWTASSIYNNSEDIDWWTSST